MTATFDYVAFINSGFQSQQRYAEAAGQLGPLDILEPKDRYAKVIEMMGHLIEEVIEARCLTPRRSWKTGEPGFLDNEKIRKEFISEMADQLLFHRAILAYAGIDGEEFAKVAMEKFHYNTKRKDHLVNGNELAPQDPIAELQGDCPSANFFG
jgi:NTP pyrophosphatase (non-canonical NTP hydrolase)